MSGAEAAPLVFVTVGTDHHPFHRLVDWIDGWLASPEGAGVRCIVQYGTSKRPERAESYDYLPYPEMERLSKEAVAVVSHGGPGSLMLVRWHGKRPIAVPRRHELGEHVDNHQVVFTSRLAQEGEVELVQDEAGFREALRGAVSGTLSLDLAPPDEMTGEAMLRFGKLMDELLATEPRSLIGVLRGRRPRSRWASRSEEGDRQRVLYIGGWGRSGSTLLERMLAELPGFVCVGEVREIWQRSLMENRPCGCGAAFRDCPFWIEVGRSAYGGWDRVDLQEVHRLRYRLDRGFGVPRLLSPATGADLRRYVGWLRPLYRAIAEVSGASVVIDSSKLPTHAMILRRIPDLDVRLLHLVRDSRGVAWSWQKRVQSAVAEGEARFLYRYSAIGSSLRYDFYNALTAGLRRTGMPYLRMRYEDLVADPTRRLEAIGRFVDAPVSPPDLRFVADGAVQLHTSHTLDGNPIRFSVGAVPLRLDDEWRRLMPRSDRFWVGALTAPLLSSYGYRSADAARRSR